MPRVILDAGHGGSDIGEYYKQRSEKNDNLRLAFRVGKFLEQYSIETGYTRTTDRYLPTQDRVAIAKKIGGDLLVSIHRFACNNHSEESGLDFFIRENDKLGEVAANHIGRDLYNCGYIKYRIIVRSDVPFLNDMDIPVLMAEIGYLRAEIENDIFDNNFVPIAEEIAKGICETLLPASPDQRGAINYGVTVSYHYRISIGPYHNYNMAMEQQFIISRLGHETEIVRSGNQYMIYVGEYEELEEAVSVEIDLRRCGYCTFINRV
jgi:N-acetylmuramoyl-L-alanine amidase